MPHAQLSGHIEQKHVLIAEAPGSAETSGCARTTGETPIPPGQIPGLLPGSLPGAVGYCIGVDKYFKREDVGVIYQMNIVPDRRRGLVAATLLRAMFERSAYGVKLYCCWCAQDLEANRFWEAMGFVPLAFRTGSRKKSWWFPSQTGSGAMREDRIVLPIPPGTHWSDAKPAVLPGVEDIFGEIAAERGAPVKLIAGAEGSGAKGLSAEEKAARKAERKAKREQAKRERAEAAARAASVASGGLHFGAPPEAESSNGKSDAAKQARKEAEKAAQKKVSKKNDPRLVAMARELRDRWQEHVAPGSELAGMIEDRQQGKYDVSRLIEASPPQGHAIEIVSEVEAEPKRLDAA